MLLVQLSGTFAGDGSDHKRRMGATAYCLGDPDVQQCVGESEANKRRQGGLSEGDENVEIWVVWCRSRKKGNEELERLLSEDGSEVFQGKCGGGEAKGEDESEEKEIRKSRTRKSKVWWRRGDVGAYQNAGNMTCCAHRELAAVDEETRNNMEVVWEAEDDKDECIVNLEGPERNYWLGSEAGMLGCYRFSGVGF